MAYGALVGQVFTGGGMSAELLVKKVDSVTDVTVTDASGKQYPVETVGDYWKCKVDEYGEYTTNFKVNGVQSKPRKTIVDTCKQYYPVSFSGTLNQTSWSDIRLASDMGIASTIWAVGDTKAIRLVGYIGDYDFNSSAISVYILGFNHNMEKEGNNRIHFGGFMSSSSSVAIVDSWYGDAQYNETQKRYCIHYPSQKYMSWARCRMRHYVLGADSSDPASAPDKTLLKILPNDLKSVLKKVTKYSYHASMGVSSVESTEDWCFLLGEYEVLGKIVYSNEVLSEYQKQYDWYKLHGPAKYGIGYSNLSCQWWLRDVDKTYDGIQFCCIDIHGHANFKDSSYSLGLAPCFCV